MIVVEVLVWVVIVSIIATFVARVIFGHQLIAGEDRFVASLGISPDVHFLVRCKTTQACDFPDQIYWRHHRDGNLRSARRVDMPALPVARVARR
jgi:hypothetical protein